MKRNAFSYSILLPKLNLTKNETLNTETDDVNFAENQYKKLDKELFIKKFRKLKPWEKSCNNNIYSLSGRSNHFILKDLNHKLNSKDKKQHGITPKNIDWSTIGNYSQNEINNINNSLLLVKNFKDKDKLKQKMKIPKLNIKSYIDNTKEICLDGFFSRMIKEQRKKMKTKHIEYERILKKEWSVLTHDIQVFEDFKKNNKNQIKKDGEILIKLKRRNKYLNEQLKTLSQENRNNREEIRKEIQIILYLKTYSNFINKLFGNTPNILNNDFNGNINYNRLNDNDLGRAVNEICLIFKNFLSDNMLDNSLNELLEDENKINATFKMMEKNIIDINTKLEAINKEKEVINNNNYDLKTDLINKINYNKNEYSNLLKQYEKEKSKYNEIELDINKETSYKQKLLIELYEYIKNVNISKEDQLNEKYFFKEIIRPLFDDIKQKEDIINKLITELEAYNKDNKEIFYKITHKLKQNNRIKKYFEERKIKEAQNEDKKIKIFEKISQKVITGRNKFKSPNSLNFFKNKKKLIQKTNSKNIDDNLIYY